VGVLAESWTAKGTEWIFKLRRNIKFHSGADLTAADVVYTFKRSTDSKLSRQNQLRRLVKSIHATDSYTLSVTTENPLVSFLEYIDNLTILSETTAKESGDEGTFGGKPVGTGPFRFVEWTRGGMFVMERNPGYWGKAPRIDRVIWRSVPEVPARIAALEAGQAKGGGDVVGGAVGVHLVEEPEALLGKRCRKDEDLPVERVVLALFRGSPARR
jgi:peptide/nickel transport system substrate-binding protein